MEIVEKSKQQLEGSNAVFFGSVTQKDNKGKYIMNFIVKKINKDRREMMQYKMQIYYNNNIKKKYN